MLPVVVASQNLGAKRRASRAVKGRDSKTARGATNAITPKQRAYRLDPVRGAGWVTIAISMPPARNAELRVWAKRSNMAISHFMREAAFRYAAELGLVTAGTAEASP